jgi:hypothetical protein
MKTPSTSTRDLASIGSLRTANPLVNQRQRHSSTPTTPAAHDFAPRRLRDLLSTCRLGLCERSEQRAGPPRPSVSARRARAGFESGAHDRYPEGSAFAPTTSRHRAGHPELFGGGTRGGTTTFDNGTSGA